MNNLNIDIREQKENECLPACLRAVFSYFKVDVSEEEIIETISKGSFKFYDWDFNAGKMAIEKGLKTEVYTNVSQIFDPSWVNLSSNALIGKIEEELKFFKFRNENFEKDPDLMTFMCPNKEVAERLVKEAEAIIEFLKLGGVVNFDTISKELIEQKLKANVPVIISHNPTLLHRMKRFSNGEFNDIEGSSWGHAAIISGEDNGIFLISDPDGIFYEKKLVYEANKDLVLESILRYNGQLLVISR